MLLKIFVYYLSLIYFVEAQGYRCPSDPNLLVGCTCAQAFTNSEYKITVQCNNFNGVEIDFKENLSKLQYYEIDELIINNYMLNKLPDDTFRNTIIKKISIINSPNLQSFGTKTSFFDGLKDSLETLRLENLPKLSDTKEFGKIATSLASTTVFKHLYVFNNGFLRFINFNDFRTLTSIERIVMRRNYLYGQFNADLSSFYKLRHIDLSENSLDTILITGYPPLLTTIYLGSNNIMKFPESQTNSLPNIQFIDLSSNPLSCFCTDIKYIMDNRLQGTFQGRCSSPSQLNNKVFGTVCTSLRRLITNPK